MKIFNLNRTILFLAAFLPVSMLKGADARSVIGLLDLTRPGLDKVAGYYNAGNDSLATVALLDYYRHRTGVKSIGVDPDNPQLTDRERKWADDGMEHKFYVHDGYQPSYFYGDDIDWQYWPVKDNELRWQLHRTKWWVSMGKAYRVTGDEKYAGEWVAQYRDWVRKNPLTEFEGIKDTDMENADNVYFAWRPLEVGDRLEHQIEQFSLFLPSEHFTPDFLIEFLDNYHRHAEFVDGHYSDEGNHLLFEAQRIIFAGTYFPEFRKAADWRKAGVDILTREIVKQVYPDGVHYELDPRYHPATIDIFGKALAMLNINGYTDEFPPEYIDVMRKMIEFNYNITFPDYSMPMFSDGKKVGKSGSLPRYKSWLKISPDDAALKYFASEGKEGNVPDYTSRAFENGGFYILRNGWGPAATVMILKAGPEGEWHNQFDNGTFELWIKGRNFFPDSGSFIYGGDEEVLKQRDWFRQTSVHNTLTLDNKTLEKRKSNLLKWETNPEVDMVVVETPGYKGLTHRRAVFFVDKKFYVIVDEAYGDAEGDVALHYQLLPCDPLENSVNKSVTTAFADNNNVTVRVFGADRMTAEEGWTSFEYRQKNRRPAYAFSTGKKKGEPARFITVICPVDAENPLNHKISADYKGKFSVDGSSLEVTVDGKKYKLGYRL
ncbi:MAG: heparinase [Bacteroidales bacterium]|nr:heparinase [Bacteroidales bacterium]